MSSPMGPPVVPGFSLRVQLFAPNAYRAGDKPIRCFRVVTSPDVTIRDFCEEASRIHEVNYGQPITIKKCQDDQEFDVTQSEVVGNLFASAATIRVIQASSTVSIRDSVPPDSALRYDPALLSNSKKRRKRGSGVQANGALSPAFISNKRQRLSDVDPDMPIPSSESDLGSSQGGHSAVTIPDSQQNTGRPGFIRSEIPATVSPPPYPALLHSIEKRPTNQTRHKPATASKSSAQSVVAPGSPSRPVAPASAPTKSKSTSYHIERATERGTSVSTAATSPLSADQQFPPHNRSTLTAQSRLSGPLSSVRSNGQPGPNQRNNQTVYDVDEIESDSASSSATLDKTKALLKTKKSPLNGRPQHEKANEFNTPPPGYRRNSYLGDQTSTPELPPTPSSKQREEKQQRHDGAEKYRNAAAEAAKQRFRDVSEQKKREAEEARKAEQAKIAELVRLKKEEQERVAADKRAAVAATAARLEKERVEKMKSERKAEEDRLAKKKLAEEERLKKAKEQVEGLEKEKNAGIEKQKNSEDKMRRDKAKAEAEAKIERLRKDQEQKRKAEAAAADESRNAMEQALAEKTPTEKRKLSSASLESSKSGSRTGPSPAPRPQSSTPFIPSGKKSALKYSQAILPSSSAPREPPSDVSMTSSQITPTGGQRRVSFNHEVTRIMLSVEDQDSTNLRKAKQTPVKPPIKDQKSSKLQEVPPEKQTYTRILPPGNNFSKAISTTPILPPKKSTSSITPPTSITPKVIVKSASPIPAPPSKNSESQDSSAAKGKSNEAQVAVVLESGENTSSEGSDSEDHDSDETNPANILNSAIRPSTLSPKAAAKLEPGLKEQGNQEQEDDIEMGSGQSTPPETRSPVIFNRQPAGLAPVPALELSKAAGEDEEEIQSASDALSSDGGSYNSSADEDEEDDGDEDEEMDEEESEDLPRSQASSQPNMLADKRTWRKFQSSPSLSDKESTTQDAVDYQLTSSIYEANTSSPKKTLSKNKSETASVRPNSQRPKFKIGASLQDLNAAQGMAERNRASTQQALIENRSLKLIGDEDSGSESEIESGEDTDSESDDEEAASKALEVQLSQAQSIPLPDSDEDSSSDSDNEEQFREKMKNELVADLARMVQRSGSQRSATSMSSSRIGGQDKSRIAGKDIVKAEKKEREKKYLTGYTFSQVR